MFRWPTRPPREVIVVGATGRRYRLWRKNGTGLAGALLIPPGWEARVDAFTDELLKARAGARLPQDERKELEASPEGARQMDLF